MVHFLVDSIAVNKPYPALATHSAQPYTASWREFGQHYPYTVPVNLFDHAHAHGVELNIVTEYDASYTHVYYPIGIGFWDHRIDYIELLPEKIKSLFEQERIRLLFYYHEGDNPHVICARIEQLLSSHGYSTQAYVLISGNTSVLKEKKGIFFADHELLYWSLNRGVLTSGVFKTGRNYAYTALNRAHKWSRASIMADLHRLGVLDRSIWSYNSTITVGDRAEDNPIAIHTIPGLAPALDRFLTYCQPHSADGLTSDQHNDHSVYVDHSSDSYCSIILETLYEADGTSGAFLTEKTFKCLKHGHPFVIAGCAGSLALLRDLGYRTFDHAIDNTYDTIADPTRRWLALRSALVNMLDQDWDSWFESCVPDLMHNQQLFLASKQDRVNKLLRELDEKYDQ